MSDEAVPDDLLTCKDADTLCKWMCCFVQEMCKEKGENYPPLVGCTLTVPSTSTSAEAVLLSCI